MENRVHQTAGTPAIAVRIGSLPVPRGALLAPMAGVTDLFFRLLCHEQGSVLAFTEMVSAKGFLHAPEQRAVLSLLETASEEGPVALQLFGHEPEEMAEAARRLTPRGFAAIDLNMGCPAPKITRGGDGSALLKDLPLAGRIIAAVRRATPLPLTVKARAGWDENSLIVERFARMAESEGADALTVHGRTRMQFYAGEADWSHISRAKAAVRIPVIGNGDIFTAADAVRRLAETGCDAVMVGRGSLGNPWIFAQIASALSGRPVRMPSPAERIQAALRHASMLCAWKGEGTAIREMRKHAAWYTRGLAGAAKMRVRMQQASTLAELEGMLWVCMDNQK